MNTKFGEKSVLFLMAADVEYGDHLKRLFTPQMVGVGPVEAAVNTTEILAACQTVGELPDLVVSLGSAGSPHLEQAEVYQVSKLSYRDMDASALGFEKGQTPLTDLPVVVTMPYRIEGILTATLATGASVVSGNGYDAIDAQMVDMETFAIFRACQKFDVPLIGLRGISDGEEELQRLTDWTQYLHIVDEKLAQAVARLRQALEKGLLDG